MRRLFVSCGQRFAVIGVQLVREIVLEFATHPSIPDPRVIPADQEESCKVLVGLWQRCGFGAGELEKCSSGGILRTCLAEPLSTGGLRGSSRIAKQLKAEAPIFDHGFENSFHRRFPPLSDRCGVCLRQAHILRAVQVLLGRSARLPVVAESFLRLPGSDGLAFVSPAVIEIEATDVGIRQAGFPEHEFIDEVVSQRGIPVIPKVLSTRYIFPAVASIYAAAVWCTRGVEWEWWATIQLIQVSVVFKCGVTSFWVSRGLVLVMVEVRAARRIIIVVTFGDVVGPLGLELQEPARILGILQTFSHVSEPRQGLHEVAVDPHFGVWVNFFDQGCLNVKSTAKKKKKKKRYAQKNRN